MFKPFPKLIGFLGMLAAIAGPLASMFTQFNPKYAAIAAGIGGTAAALSHSLTGTGGKDVQ